MVTINKIEDFPTIARKGRQTEEVVMVREALVESIKSNGQPFELSGITPEDYNNWQQRVRTQAKRLGVNVEIRFNPESETLAFRPKDFEAKEEVKKKTPSKSKK
jgi:hypothetical protein